MDRHEHGGISRVPAVHTMGCSRGRGAALVWQGRRMTDDSSGPLTADDRLWTVQQLAEYLHIPVKTIYKWRETDSGPRGLRIGKHVRFRPTDVFEWLEAR